MFKATHKNKNCCISFLAHGSVYIFFNLPATRRQSIIFLICQRRRGKVYFFSKSCHHGIVYIFCNLHIIFCIKFVFKLLLKFSHNNIITKNIYTIYFLFRSELLTSLESEQNKVFHLQGQNQKFQEREKELQSDLEASRKLYESKSL